MFLCHKSLHFFIETLKTDKKSQKWESYDGKNGKREAHKTALKIAAF